MRPLFLLKLSVLSKDYSRCLTPKLTFAFEMQRGGTAQQAWAWSSAALVVANRPPRAENGLLSRVREKPQNSRKMHSYVIHTIGCLYSLVQYTSGCKASLRISSKLLVLGVWLMVKWVHLS